jgi:VIT1/CCC1 family predicted Fe2+/Mn2+ transporter
MLVLQLLIEGLPALASRLPKLQADSLFGASEHLSSWRKRDVRDRPKGERAARTTRIVLWIGGFTGLVYGFGFLVAVPVFLLLYLRTEARLTWTGSLLAAGVATGVLYLVFSVLLGLPFPAGAIG